MKELVQYLARSLVNNPDAVDVNETESDAASVVEIKSREGRSGTHHRQARPNGEIDPDHPERRGVAKRTARSFWRSSKKSSFSCHGGIRTAGSTRGNHYHPWSRRVAESKAL